MKNLFIIAVLFPVFSLAQIQINLAEHGLKGKIKSFTQVEYEQNVANLTLGNITDTAKWSRTIVYHFDSLGNYQKRELAVRYPFSEPMEIIRSIWIFKKDIAETFDENGNLIEFMYMKKISDSSYTVTVVDAKTKVTKYKTEQFLDKNYRDIGGTFSSYITDNGIHKLYERSSYKNKLDENGHLLSSTEISESDCAHKETWHRYLKFDTHGNPLTIIQRSQENGEPKKLINRKYIYY